MIRGAQLSSIKNKYLQCKKKNGVMKSAPSLFSILHVGFFYSSEKDMYSRL